MIEEFEIALLDRFKMTVSVPDCAKQLDALMATKMSERLKDLCCTAAQNRALWIKNWDALRVLFTKYPNYVHIPIMYLGNQSGFPPSVDENILPLFLSHPEAVQQLESFAQDCPGRFTPERWRYLMDMARALEKK